MTNVIPIRSADPELQRLWDEFLRKREVALMPAATILDGIAAGKAFGAFVAAVADEEARPGA